jgi:hypothetical protein
MIKCHGNKWQLLGIKKIKSGIWVAIKPNYRKKLKLRLWCIRNKIYISPFAKDPGSWYIDITLNGKVNRSPHIYVKDMIWENIYKFYKYYYDKYKK